MTPVSGIIHIIYAAVGSASICKFSLIHACWLLVSGSYREKHAEDMFRESYCIF